MKIKYLVLIMGMLLVGCSAPAAATELAAPTETAATLPPTETPTLVPPTPTKTLGPPTATPEVISNEEPEVWDLVYISDSTGWGVADKYAARIEQDLGVQVKVHDLWGPNLPVSTILNALRGKPHTWMSYISEELVDPIPYIEMAEVIVVHGNEWGSQTTEHPWVWSCFEEEPFPACRETTSCGPETFAQYEANLAAIFEEIFAIRGGEPVILRTVDLYLPWGPLEAWRACDQEEICKQCLLNWSDAIHRVADEYGVPVAGLLTAFSGPDMSLDMPREFIMDDRHPSDKGTAAFADVLADLGYEPVEPRE